MSTLSEEEVGIIYSNPINDGLDDFRNQFKSNFGMVDLNDLQEIVRSMLSGGEFAFAVFVVLMLTMHKLLIDSWGGCSRSWRFFQRPCHFRRVTPLNAFVMIFLSSWDASLLEDSTWNRQLCC